MSPMTAVLLAVAAGGLLSLLCFTKRGRRFIKSAGTSLLVLIGGVALLIFAAFFYQLVANLLPW